jgi:hypothetical protein
MPCVIAVTWALAGAERRLLFRYGSQVFAELRHKYVPGAGAVRRTQRNNFLGILIKLLQPWN